MSRTGDNIHKRKDRLSETHCSCNLHFKERAQHRTVHIRTFADFKERTDKSNQNRFTPKKDIPSEKFGDLLDRWLESNRIKVKVSTENKYRYMVELHIKPLLGDYAISQLSTQIINDFLSTKLSGSTKNSQTYCFYYLPLFLIYKTKRL